MKNMGRSKVKSKRQRKDNEGERKMCRKSEKSEEGRTNKKRKRAASE